MATFTQQQISVVSSIFR